MQESTPNLDDPEALQKSIAYFEVSPIIARFGTWAVTTFGIESLEHPYKIDLGRANEGDWADHMSEKTWVCMADFAPALNKARELLQRRTSFTAAGRPLSVFLCHAKEDAEQCGESAFTYWPSEQAPGWTRKIFFQAKSGSARFAGRYPRATRSLFAYLRSPFVRQALCKTKCA